MNDYRQFFAKLAGGPLPYGYQERVAEELWGRRNVVVRAPTGCGKTLAVLGPFLYGRERIGVGKLIYALPLRTLVQGIYREAGELARRCNDPGLKVTIQTGEQPCDPFFTLGDIIVTTYDQVLSGMLCGPYGLSRRLSNINAAAVAGNLVVFDEFHLMEPSRAFLTGVGCLSLFGGVCRSVWMTATATTPLIEQLRGGLGAVEISMTAPEMENAPAISGVKRAVVKEPGELNAEAVLCGANGRSLVVVNQVARAQRLFGEISAALKLREMEIPVELLHSRFFAPDRQRKQEGILERFGEGGTGPAILIATQVIEAGLNLTCDNLHTEVCPMNGLVQRAGRCARFAGETGTVHVYDVNGRALPYRDEEVRAAWNTLPEEEADLMPAIAAAWVEACHAADDERGVGEGWRARRRTCQRRIEERVRKQDQGGVADLIRDGGDQIPAIVHNDPGTRPPAEFEAIAVWRGIVKGLLRERGQIGWVWDEDGGWKEVSGANEVDGAYAVCLRTSVARYTDTLGLELGLSGEHVSPSRTPPRRRGHKPSRREAWTAHTTGVMKEVQELVKTEARAGGLLAKELGGERLAELARLAALLHDLGKLQEQWQRWAEGAQRARDPGYVHTKLLAHTDESAENAACRGRPAHAMASALYGAKSARIARCGVDPGGA